MNAGAFIETRGRRGDWVIAAAGAVVVTWVLLLIMAFAHRVVPEPPPVESTAVIQAEAMADPDEPAEASGTEPVPDVSVLLPPASEPVTPLEVETPPLDVSLDLAQVLQWRYSYADLGRKTMGAPSFGLSNQAEVAGSVKSIVIPPQFFPDELIAQGIVEGCVVVAIIIDEQGRAKVQSVISSTHPRLVAPVVESMNRAVYSIPLRDGRPVRALIRRVVVFRADPTKSLPVYKAAGTP